LPGARADGRRILIPLVIAAMAVLAGWVSDLAGAPESISAFLAVAGVLAGVVGTTGLAIRFVLLRADLRRALTNEFYPLLAKALAPLAPSREELEAVLQAGKGRGSRLAARLEVPRLFDEILLVCRTS
jgi:hypothetical protein